MASVKLRCVPLLKGWLNFLFTPPFDWIQVEPTSRCNASCLYCPRTVFRKNWVNRNLLLEDFKRLIPVFTGTRMVYLQGWGEPLLNPDLLTMIQLAREAGCRVGTTTNGILLNKKKIDQIVTSGLDVLAISLAGLAPGNNSLRQGTNFDNILTALRLLQESKRQQGTNLPAVHIAYMLLKSGLEEINKLPASLKNLGISQVVVSTLDFVPCKILQKETIAPDTAAAHQQVYEQLASVKQEGEQYGLEIHFQIYRPGIRRLSCTENIQRSLFISAAGDISPCVFYNLPLIGIRQIYLKDKQDYQPLIFGNMNQEELTAIWRKKKYKAFRKDFERNRLPALCASCPKLFLRSV